MKTNEERIYILLAGLRKEYCSPYTSDDRRIVINLRIESLERKIK